MSKKRGSYNKDNNFALKWVPEEIKRVLDAMITWLSEDPKGLKCQYIGEAVSEIGLQLGIPMYNEIWSYWKHTAREPIGIKAENESQETKAFRAKVFKTIKNIEDLIQSRMVSGAMRMKTSVPMSIFILKNQGWSDQQHLDITSDDEKIGAFDGELKVKIINTNPDITLDEDGNIVKDDTK